MKASFFTCLALFAGLLPAFAEPSAPGSVARDHDRMLRLRAEAEAAAEALGPPLEALLAGLQGWTCTPDPRPVPRGVIAARRAECRQGPESPPVTLRLAMLGADSCTAIRPDARAGQAFGAWRFEPDFHDGCVEGLLRLGMRSTAALPPDRLSDLATRLAAQPLAPLRAAAAQAGTDRRLQALVSVQIARSRHLEEVLAALGARIPHPVPEQLPPGMPVSLALATLPEARGEISRDGCTIWAVLSASADGLAQVPLPRTAAQAARMGRVFSHTTEFDLKASVDAATALRLHSDCASRAGLEALGAAIAAQLTPAHGDATLYALIAGGR